MIKKYLYSMILVLAIIFNGNAQTYSSVIDDSTILKFIEWRLKNDPLPNSNVDKKFFTFSNHFMPWKNYEFTFRDNEIAKLSPSQSVYNKRNLWLDTVFYNADKTSLQQQSLFCSTKEIKLQFPQNASSKANYRHSFTTPIFSLNKQYAVVKDYYYCGEDSGEFYTCLYKKSGNIWKFVSELASGTF